MDEELLAELRSGIEMLTATIEAQISGNSALIDSTRDRLTEENNVRKQAQAQNKENERRRRIDKAMHDAQREDQKRTQEQVKKTKEDFKKLGKELYSVIDSGIKFSATIGTTATKGVELEVKNRIAVASQLLKFDLSLADLGATMEQVKNAQQGLTDAFISTREGMQLSAEGSVEFVRNLKEGFKSEFEPTAETFRILTQMGMSTTTQFEAFRKATGRASLSNNQLATLYNKNQLSFLLYGNSFAKAAVQAERLGINLASIQSAQESLVTNLDGTIDTVAQLNQIGANISFDELVRISEQEGPDALLAYVRASVPQYMMQNASTRALFKQLGISVEDYIKSGEKQQSAANQLEAQMTEAAKETSKFTKAISLAATYLGRGFGLLQTTILPLVTSIYAAIASIRLLGAEGMKTAITNFATGLGNLGFSMGTVAALAAGISLMYFSRRMGEEGNTTGAAVGGAAAGMLMMAPIIAKTPGWYKVIPAIIGAVGGYLFSKPKKPLPAGDLISTPGKKTSISPIGSITSQLESQLDKKNKRQNLVESNTILSSDIPITVGNNKPDTSLMAVMSNMTGLKNGLSSVVNNRQLGDDVLSTPDGYGDRMLLTPEGPIALNNKDTVMAFADDMMSATKTFPLGFLAEMMSGRGSNNSALEKKVEQLIDTISSATTVVNVDNTYKQVPRIAMAGVYTRNGRGE